MLKSEGKGGLDECGHKDGSQAQETAPGEKILAVGCSVEIKTSN